MTKRYLWAALAAVAVCLVLFGISKLTNYAPAIRLQAAQILVANSGTDFNYRHSYISVYPGNADGDIEPIINLAIESIGAMALDNVGYLYVAGDNRILVYTMPRNGQAQLLRTIQGPKTQISVPVGLAINSLGELYVSNYGGPNQASSIVKFAAGVSGNISPIAVIPAAVNPDGSSTGIGNTGLKVAGGIAIDKADRLYVVDRSMSDKEYGGLHIFAADASGDVAPLVSIANPDATLQLRAVALGSNEEVYISTRQPTSGTGDRVIIYPPRPTSSSKVLRYFESKAMQDIDYLAVDDTDQIYVPVYEAAVPRRSHSVLVFPAGSKGTVTPVRTIEGKSTRLDGPTAIAVRGVFQFPGQGKNNGIAPAASK
jgi:hypothetical protein